MTSSFDSPSGRQPPADTPSPGAQEVLPLTKQNLDDMVASGEQYGGRLVEQAYAAIRIRAALEDAQKENNLLKAMWDHAEKELTEAGAALRDAEELTRQSQAALEAERTAHSETRQLFQQAARQTHSLAEKVRLSDELPSGLLLTEAEIHDALEQNTYAPGNVKTALRQALMAVQFKVALEATERERQEEHDYYERLLDETERKLREAERRVVELDEECRQSMVTIAEGRARAERAEAALALARARVAKGECDT